MKKAGRSRAVIDTPEARLLLSTVGAATITLSQTGDSTPGPSALVIPMMAHP